MNKQKSKQNISATSNTSRATSTTTDNSINRRKRIIQNYSLIWIDPNIHEIIKDAKHTLGQLRAVVNDINLFTKPEQCIQFLNEFDNEKAFVITSGTLGQNLVPHIHDMSKLDSIYIFCINKARHEQWVKQWKKIKGVHTSIKPVREALQMAVKQCEQDSIPVNFVAMNKEASRQDLNQLEPNFMYTQIFKDILLDMEYGQQSLNDLANYCRKFYDGNTDQLAIIDEFEHKYQPKSAIWWYTRDCFLYQILNRALRTLEVDIIINMGFFIRDLHQQIKQLHQQQISGYQKKPFTIYRGQGLSTEDFEKLYKAKGGLISFDSFLSTSTKRHVSLVFANGALTKTNMVGILFQIFVDPSVSSAPFAAIKEISYYQTEEEILFSMHTIFRIGEIKQIDTNKPLHQVELTITSDDDQQLRTLTKYIQKTARGTGWERIGNLLLYLKKFDRAEELYTSLLEQASDEIDKALYYNNLGYVKNDQGDYRKAIWYFERGLESCQKTHPVNLPLLATSYSNIGLAYYSMEDYSKALSFYEKAFEIHKQTRPVNYSSLATSNNNIGLVYHNMGDYSKALSFYEKGHEILQKTLPANHPDLATSYNNIAAVYDLMKEHSKALSVYEKAHGIFQKTLPADHPSLITSYNNIGEAYTRMGNYSKALPLFEHALNISQKSLPSNHPNIKTVLENIEFVRKKL